MCQWKFLVLKYSAKKWASSALSEPVISRVASCESPLGVRTAADCRDFTSLTCSVFAMVSSLSLNFRWGLRLHGVWIQGRGFSMLISFEFPALQGSRARQCDALGNARPPECV